MGGPFTLDCPTEPTKQSILQGAPPPASLAGAQVGSLDQIAQQSLPRSRFHRDNSLHRLCWGCARHPSLDQTAQKSLPRSQAYDENSLCRLYWAAQFRLDCPIEPAQVSPKNLGYIWEVEIYHPSQKHTNKVLFRYIF